MKRMTKGDVAENVAGFVAWVSSRIVAIQTQKNVLHFYSLSEKYNSLKILILRDSVNETWKKFRCFRDADLDFLNSNYKFDGIDEYAETPCI